MAETLEWILKARDLISPGTSSAVAGLIRLEVELKRTSTELSTLEKVSHSLNIGDKLKGAAGSVLGIVGSVATGIKDTAVGFGEMVLSGAAFREDTTVAFKQILGSAEKADQLFENALAVARQTKFETRDVVGLYTDLLGAGFKQHELNTLVAGLADVGTNRGIEYAQRLENALAKTKALGKLTGDALSEATIAGGFERKKVLQNVADAMGLKGSTDQLAKKVEAALKKGAVDGGVGIMAILKTVGDQLDPGGQLGDFAKAQSNTLNGVWSNFKESFSNLFMSKETQELPALKTLKQTMLMLSDFFDATKPKGQAVLAVVNRLANDMLSIFELDPANAEKTFTKLLGWLEGAERVVRRLTTWIKSELFPAIGEAFNQEGGLGKTLTNVLLTIGRVVGQGIWEGVKGATGIGGGGSNLPNMGTSVDLGKVLGDRVQIGGSATAKLIRDEQERANLPKIQVPEGMPAGVFTLDGVPKFAAGGIVDRPTLAVVGEAGPEAIIPLGRGGGALGGVGEMHVTINIAGSGSPAETARQVRVELMKLLGGAARAPSPSRL